MEHKPSARDIENSVLSEEIKKIFDEHKARYGSLRITKVLEQNGIKVNRKRVARLMRMMNLSPKVQTINIKDIIKIMAKRNMQIFLIKYLKLLIKIRYGWETLLTFQHKRELCILLFL